MFNGMGFGLQDALANVRFFPPSRRGNPLLLLRIISFNMVVVTDAEHLAPSADRTTLTTRQWVPACPTLQPECLSFTLGLAPARP